MRRRDAFTLIEMVLSLAILTLIVGITATLLQQTLLFQAQQEATAAAQAKLRRVVEVVSQDLRGAVFGHIANSPYSSQNDAISFLIAEGGTAYPVFNTGSSFATSSLATFVASGSASELAITVNGRVLMVNRNNQGVILPITAITQGIGNLWTVSFGCQNTISYTEGTVMYPIREVGYRYDPTSRNLLYSENGAAQVASFNLSSFVIDYVYQTDTGTPAINPSGYNTGGVIRDSFSAGTTTYTLQRLQIRLQTQERGFAGRLVTRSYSTQIELPSRRLQGGIIPCNP